jgi:hypothetical protein
LAEASYGYFGGTDERGNSVPGSGWLWIVVVVVAVLVVFSFIGGWRPGART